MGMMDEIKREIEKNAVPKWKILKDKIEREILEMVKNNIPITKQIELILKYGVVEKLERKEYTNILERHFGYVKKNSRGKNKTPKMKPTGSIKKEPVKKIPQPKAKIEKPAEKKSVEDRLSADIDLMDFKK